MFSAWGPQIPAIAMACLPRHDHHPLPAFKPESDGKGFIP
jgi:hypothetical protein